MQVDRPIFIALILFAVLLLVFFAVAPEYKVFKDLRIELAEKKAEYNAKFDYYSAISKAYFELQKRPDALEKVNDALPQDPQMGDIVYFLQKTAADNGIVVRDLFLSKAPSTKTQGKEPEKIKTIAFTLDLMGNYSALQRFAVAIEKSARLFEITSITFGTGIQITQQTPEGPSVPAQQTNNYTLQIETHSY